MQHTPGPWNVERMQAYNQTNRLAVTGNGLALVTHTFDGEQAEVNMRLIAAAPELLAACARIMEEAQRDCIDESEWSEGERMAHAAIMKACGIAA